MTEPRVPDKVKPALYVYVQFIGVTVIIYTGHRRQTVDSFYTLYFRGEKAIYLLRALEQKCEGKEHLSKV